MENKQLEVKGLVLKILFGLCALIILPIVGLFFGTLHGSDGLLLGLILGCMAGGALFLLLMWNLLKSKEGGILLGGYGVLGCLILFLKLSGIDSKISWMPFLFYYFAVPLRLMTSTLLNFHSQKTRQPTASRFSVDGAGQGQGGDDEKAKVGTSALLSPPTRVNKNLVIALVVAPLFIIFFAGLYLGATYDQGAVNQQQARERYRELHPTYTIAGIAFEKEAEWETLASGEGMSAEINPTQGLFCTKDKKALYGLLGTTALDDRSPEEFFAGMKAYYAESNEILEAEDLPAPWTSPDGVACFVGTIKMTDSRQVYYMVTILMAPEKNLAVTFYGQSKQEDREIVNMEKMWQTAVFSQDE